MDRGVTSALMYENLDDYAHLQREIIEEEGPQAMALGTLLLKKLGPMSVIDIGCGPGIYLLQHKWHGCEVLGIDGCSVAGRCLDKNEFELVDLKRPWMPPKEFELSLCVEVAEHLPEEYADLLVDTISYCAPLCFFTAARPNQGGCGHFNLKPKEYWIEKFSARGFVLDVGLTDELHSVIDVDPIYKICQWLPWNAMVLRRM